MVGLENSVKGTAFYIDKDGEYQEIGTVESISLEAEENSNEWKKLEDLYNETEFTVELEVKLKKYSKKRFKKLLMSQGIQRNDAEIFATIAVDHKSYISRNDFGLIITKSIVTAWQYDNRKRKKVENNGELV